VGIKGFGYENLAKASVSRNVNTISFALDGGDLELGFADGSKSEFTAI
jgi:hypothetical protein